MKSKLLLSTFILTLVSALAFAQPPAPRGGDVPPAPGPRERAMPRAMGGPRGVIYTEFAETLVYI